MKVKVFVHPDFRSIAPVIDEVHHTYDSIGEVIHQGRNEIKYVLIQGTKYVVKYYRKVTIANRFIYGLFRKSKAQRAYKNALTLLDMGIATPRPVAYIDCYCGPVLVGCYFISQYVEHVQLGVLLRALPVSEGREMILGLARFTYRLHRKAILHMDYNMSNVLLSRDPGGIGFWLVDNNRMRFRKRLSWSLTMRNLVRIDLPLESYVVFIGEYARLSRSDAYHAMSVIMCYRQVSTRLKELRYGLKGVLAVWK